MNETLDESWEGEITAMAMDDEEKDKRSVRLTPSTPESLLDWIHEVSEGRFPREIGIMGDAISNYRHPYHKYMENLMYHTEPRMLGSVLENLFLNATMKGIRDEHEAMMKYGCSIPYAIMIDPTSRCNLHCRGCRSSEYGEKMELTYREIDDIIDQGRRVGTYTYVFSGGEPLLRRNDIVKLCNKHSECIFFLLTNGTLLDESFAENIRESGNLIPVISLDGTKEETDGIRGESTWEKAMDAISMLRSRHLIFGIATCYTHRNMDYVSSEEYYDEMIHLGAYFAWFMHYMPIAHDSNISLMPTPDDRKKMYQRIRRYRKEKPLPAIDFLNDAEHAGGCIGGGRKYLHINANGDVDPCAFVHYSTGNIRESSLLEILKSPLFTMFRDNMPLGTNMLRACPMIDEPDMLRFMVDSTKAMSTDILYPESVDELSSKFRSYSEDWALVADKLWKERKEEEDK